MSADFGALVRDEPKILWTLVADLVKAESARHSGHKTGRRPNVTLTSIDELYETLFPATYTLQAFPVALDALMRSKGVSTRALAAQIGTSQTLVARLARGSMKPTTAWMQKVASAFKVHPAWFVEYRTERCHELLIELMNAHPELTVQVFRRAFGAPA